MKRFVLLLLGLSVTLMTTAQQEGSGFSALPSDSLRPMQWHVNYDSIYALHLPLSPHPEPHPLIGNLSIQPLVAGSSIVRVDVQGLPTRIYVVNNVILQIGSRLRITNGQAWLFAPYPAGKLDARTLSLPLPK
ncbi:MAG: hypothetical protein IKY68_02705 [Alistipes sp.]|nr:hypothetical protein [Alistipes sp.]